MTGDVRPEGLTLTTQAALEPDVRLVLDEDLVAPTDVHRELWQPDRSSLPEQLLEAVATIGPVQGGASDLAGHLEDDLGVTAVGGAYAQAAADVLHHADRGLSGRTTEFLYATRHLGGPVDGFNTSLADVFDGPIRLLELLDEPPMVEVQISDSWVSAHSKTQRSRLLRYFQRLTPGVDVRIIGSRIDVRRVLESHGADLPAGVSERAHSSVTRRGVWGPAGDPEQLAQRAIEAIGTGDRQAGYWRLLEAVAEDPSPRVAQQDLERDVRFSDVSASAVRHRLSRLEDLELVERHRFGGRLHVAATAAAQRVLSVLRDVAPHFLSGRSTGDHGAESGLVAGGQSTGVSDPPTFPQGPCYPNARRTGPPASRPPGEAEAAAKGGSTASPAAARYLSLAEHHRAAAASTPDGGVALEDRPLEPVDDRRRPAWSFDEDRGEIVVSVVASPAQAVTAVRLCCALLNPKAEKEVLSPDNLRGSPERFGLEGLAVSNPYVLRRGATIGWLRNVDADGGRFLDRLRRARDDLLAELVELSEEGAYKDPEDLGSLLRRAHGLMGVLVRVYDLLGYDVVRELRVPEPTAIDLGALGEFVTRASAISGRYGVYTAYRTLYEDRERKREDALGAPDVDPDAPVGEAAGSWVVVGPGVDRLAGVLEAVPDRLDLQEDGENFAEFAIPHEVVDGSRREAYAVLLARMLPFKNLQKTRESLAVLRTLTGSVYDAAAGLARLGAGDGRDVDHGDLEHALVGLVDELGADRLLPDLGGSTVSSVVATLLQQREPVTTAELAEAADCSRQSIRDNRDRLQELEALGLLELQEGDAGEAHRWSFSLPGADSGDMRAVERSSAGSTPGFVPAEPGSGEGERWLSDSLFDLIVNLPDRPGLPDPAGSLAMAAFSGGWADRDLGPLLEASPRLQELAWLLAQLLDVDDQLPDGTRFGGSFTLDVELGVRPDRAGRQVALGAG